MAPWFKPRMRGKLLDPSNDFVTHLRHHAGFIKEGGFWEGPKLI